MKIRLYQPQDLEAILKLAKELSTALAERLGRETDLGQVLNVYVNRYLKQGKKYIVFVADASAGDLVGYTIGTPTSGVPEFDCGDDLPISSHPTHRIDIDRVFVSQRFRRRSISKELIMSLSQHVKNLGHKEMFAYVAKWNTPSIALFRSLGFQEDKQKTRYNFSQSL